MESERIWRESVQKGEYTPVSFGVLFFDSSTHFFWEQNDELTS